MPRPCARPKPRPWTACSSRVSASRPPGLSRPAATQAAQRRDRSAPQRPEAAGDAWRQPPAAPASAAIRVALVLHLFLQVAVGFLRLADALLGLALDVVAEVALDVALDV